jgi:hypothetical protein
MLKITNPSCNFIIIIDLHKFDKIIFSVSALNSKDYFQSLSIKFKVLIIPSKLISEPTMSSTFPLKAAVEILQVDDAKIYQIQLKIER